MQPQTTQRILQVYMLNGMMLRKIRVVFESIKALAEKH